MEERMWKRTQLKTDCWTFKCYLLIKERSQMLLKVHAIGEIKKVYVSI